MDDIIINKTVGQKLRMYRKQRNFTQTDIGNIIGVTYQQVQKYEKGTVRLPLPSLVRICNHLNLEYKSLLPQPSGGISSVEDHRLTDDVLDLVATYRAIRRRPLRKKALQIIQILAQ